MQKTAQQNMYKFVWLEKKKKKHQKSNQTEPNQTETKQK